MQMVRGHGLPEPLWNVELRLPGGPHLGGVDAYWPDQAVAVEIDTRTPRTGDRPQDSALMSQKSLSCSGWDQAETAQPSPGHRRG